MMNFEEKQVLDGSTIITYLYAEQVAVLKASPKTLFLDQNMKRL